MQADIITSARTHPLYGCMEPYTLYMTGEERRKLDGVREAGGCNTYLDHVQTILYYFGSI